MQLSESCLKSTLAFSSIAPLLCTVQLVCGTLARHRSLPKAMALRGLMKAKADYNCRLYIHINHSLSIFESIVMDMNKK